MPGLTSYLNTDAIVSLHPRVLILLNASMQSVWACAKKTGVAIVTPARSPWRAHVASVPRLQQHRSFSHAIITVAKPSSFSTPTTHACTHPAPFQVLAALVHDRVHLRVAHILHAITQHASNHTSALIHYVAGVRTGYFVSSVGPSRAQGSSSSLQPIGNPL
jgi:hypothetical protein